MKTTLIIMAAGLGSRFGGGIKQLAPIGPNGEIIMDYSIHDAIEAGFNKIIFVIRKDIEEDFRVMIGSRIEAVCEKLGVEIAYAYQSITDIPEGCSVPAERTKPLGTGHAVLAARKLIDSPFAVINADDYYGKQAYRLVHDHLVSDTSGTCCLAGFVLRNTLSENGGVSRGICKMENGYLTSVEETHDIIAVDGQASSNGRVIDIDSIVSMNMWGLTQEFALMLERDFAKFLNNMSNPMKDEYLLPGYIGELLTENKLQIKVEKTSDKWFGVTYKEDQPGVVASVNKLIEDGIYSAELYNDLK